MYVPLKEMAAADAQLMLDIDRAVNSILRCHIPSCSPGFASSIMQSWPIPTNLFRSFTM